MPFSNPDCNWTIPNVTWLTTNNLESFNGRLEAIGEPAHAAITSEEANKIAASLYGANMTVHLVHKTQDVTNTDPDAQETRTVTADFVKVNEDGNVQDTPFNSATLDVYYIRQATKDLVTGDVTYGDWKLNTSKGTNGLQVASGSWNLPTDSNRDITVNAPDAPDGYVKVDSQVNGQSTTNFGTAANISSKLTTYYVPKSLTEKTVKRVINMSVPPAGAGQNIDSTITQSATITRPVRVNADDSGVVFDGFDGSGWTTGKWDRYMNIPVPNNYTKVIKQIVTHPDGTTTETTLNIPDWRPIPAQTVTIDTLPTVINITYTATGTAFLAGTNESTYTGSPITLNDLNDGDGDNPIYVGIEGPTGNVYELQAGDVEFSSDNGQTWTTEMPTNAGTYELRWSKQGKQNVIKEFGNNSIKWVDAQGNSTFTSTATYIINPAPATFTLSNQTSGNYTKIYDAQPTTSIDPSKLTITTNFNNAKVVLDTTGLTSDSYEWVDAQGNPISNPENVGTYYIKLKDAALSTLEKDNPNFTLTNGGGLATYTITQAQASGVLSGSNSRTYDGQATTTAEVNSNGQIGVTVTFPDVTDANKTYILKDGDYKWSSGSAPTNAGSYTITLTPDGISNIEKYILGLAGSGQNNTPNVVFADNAFTGSASYTINAAENTVSVDGTQTETYTGQPISVKYNANGNNSVQVSISSKDGATASLSNVQLDSGDFQIVDVSGKPITATSAGGVYHIVLTDTGANKIQKAVGDNYKISQGTSFGTLVINKAQASAEFSGNPSYTYTGSPNSDYLNGFSIKLNEPNNPTYNLVAGDIEFNVDGTWTTTVPVNVGKYEVRLSQAGWDHIKEINSDNVTWSATASSGTGTYTITPATANTELSGHNSMVYNGNSVTTADLYTNGSTIKVAISGNNIVNLPSSFTLEDDDYTWNIQDGKAPVNAGDYSLTLSSAGLDKIQVAIDEAVGKGNVILSKDNTGSATFQITQAISPDVQLDGNEKSEYNGHAVSFDPTNEETKKNFDFNNVQGLTIPDLTANDFEWVDHDDKQIAAPTNAGYYYLQLNEKGKSAFANTNPNYTFIKDGKSTISGRITYHIYPASLIIGVSGTASQVYNGQNAAITQTQLDNGDIKLVWGNSNDEPIGLGSFTLAPEDLEVVDSAGNPVSHANAQENDKTGDPTYYVRLTSAALNKIKNLTGASNYDISLGGTTGNFLIYARKAQVTLSGNQTTTYGTDLPLDPSAYHIELTNWNRSVPVPTEAEIIQAIGGLKSGDVYINGFTNGQMPVNVGTYQVKIADQLLQRLQVAFPDYDWDAVSGNNGIARSGSSDLNPIDARHEPAAYVITPADTTVTINGVEHIKYGENSTIQYGGDNSYSITITAPVKNATIDNEHEPIYTDLKLETGDLEFVTAPGNVGTYEVKLSAQGLKKLQALTGSTNYNWTQASAARANFFVDQMPVTITVGGNEQNVTYGSNDWLKAIKENPQGYTLTVKTENGTTLNYQAKDGDLIFSQTPGDVGSYQVVLSAQGLENIKTALGTNYAYPQDASDVTTYGTFNVNQGEVTISLNGSDSKTYDGKATTPADLNTGNYNLTYSATVYAPDGTAQTIKLTSDDLQFANGDPINAGTYTVELSPAGEAKLKNLTGNNGDNYKWTFNTKATYTINTATDASASLSGSNQMTFNGSAVTTAEINNGGDIIVNLTFPGSTENSIYHLQDGDYIWTNGEAPTNVGTYTIKLTQAGLAHLQAAIDQYAGSGNAKISADSLTGSATFEIVPKSITDVTISGKDQEKTYDGQAASLDVNSLTISGSELVTDNSLSMKGITASDFDWYDTDGNKLDAVPTNAGVYEARLKSSALQTLQADNPNYSFNTASGTIKYTINQKAVTDTLGGKGNKIYNGQETSVSDVFNSITWTPSGLVAGQSLDLSKLSETDYAWYTKNADGTYTEMTGLPTNAGTYYLKLKDSSIAKIQAANPNYSFATGAISGEYTYDISQAKAEITLPDTRTQTITWTGNPATINPANFIPEITTDNPNEKTIALPSTLQLTTSDYEFLQNGKVISAPSEVGTYQVRLSQTGWQKVQNAIAGNANYTWTYQGAGNYHIEKATATITLDGAGSTTYTGNPAVIPATDGVVNGISVELSNGQIYVLKPEDLEFINDQGNRIPAPTNADSYKVRLTAAALGQIRNLESNHYNYTYNNDAVDFIIKKATAKVGLLGNQDSGYTGSVVTLNTGNFKVLIITNNGQTLNYNLQSGDLMTTVENPTNAGPYDVYLSAQGKQNLEDINSNYNWTFADTPALLNIAPAELTIGLVGTASSVYDGNPVKITSQDQMKDLKLRWGGYDDAPDGVKFTLQPSDLVINYGADAIQAGQYAITLSAAAIQRLNQENPNYNITQSTKDLAQYIIYARKGRITLSGTQTTPYGEQVAIDPGKFTIALTDTANGQAILYPTPLSVGDLQFKDPQYSDTNLPTQVGRYELVPTSKLLAALKEYYPNYNFGDDESGQTDVAINGKADPSVTSDSNNTDVDKQHTKGANYVITPVDAYISLNGSESVRYTGKDQAIDYSKYSVSIVGLVNGDKYSYTLQAGDLEFVGTTTPNEVGNYQVKLTSQALENIRKLNSVDYNWLLSDNAHTAPFDVTQMPVTITVSDKTNVPTIIYGEDTTLNPADYTISVKTADGQTLAYTPVAGDLQFKDGTPTSTGTFEVILSNQGLQNIEKHFGTKNYTYTSTGNGSFIVKKALAGIKIVANGSDSMIYNGEAASLDAEDYKLEITTNNGQTINIPLVAGDLVFSTGSKPVNVGSYEVTLTQAALNKIKEEYPNYDLSTPVTGTYTINKASADVTTSGAYDVVYNGQTPEINVAKITNNIATNNGVNLTSPTLSADDYEWVDETGKVIANPVNVGTYYLKLKDASQSKIATNDNYTWSFNGLATVIVDKADAAISFSGSQETPYTGKVIVLDLGNFEVKFSNGQTYQLTAKDIQVIGNPINVGTYQVELSQAGIDAIKATDSNYNYSYDGSQGLLAIVPAKATATLSGSQATQNLEIDPHNYSVVITLNGQQQTFTGLTANDFVFSKDGHPAELTEAGTYDVELNGDAINKIRNENPNYDIAFSSTATFTLENSSQTINYVDADGKVISASSVGGKLKGNQVEFTPQFPVGWVASDPSSVPSEITLENGITTIKIKHGVTNIDHTNPIPDGEKTPTGKVIEGAHASDLNQIITRTIVVTKPDGTKSTEVQTAKLYRDATYDNVTGEVTYGEWSTAKWDAYTPENIPGYTVSESVVPEAEVKNGQQDETVSITYTANEQTGKISYQDVDGKEIGSTPLSGKTGETIAITPEIPAGWQLVPSQEVPKTVTATADGIPTVIIKVEHGTTAVNHNAPIPDGEKTPTGKVINGAHENDLNQTITRTIVVTKPDGTKQTIPQVAEIYRDATYDNVTGEVTYGKWSTAKWDAYTPETVPGYTANPAQVAEEDVSQETDNTTVNITYTANEQSGIISYQDVDGKEIGTTRLSGKTGETITITPDIPVGWQLVSGQEIPKTVTATAEGIPTVIVKVEHKTVVVTPETPATAIPTGKVPGDPSKNYPTMEQLTVTPTRTINVKYPSGKEESIPQKVTFTRTAIFDEVTGEIKYTEWLPQGTAQWASYQPTTVTGYVPSQKLVPAMTVNPEIPNETVDITYDKIPEPQEGQEIISYQDANGQVIHTQTVTGEEGSDVSFKPEVPTNWQPTGDLPHSVKITGGTTVIVIESVTVPVQEHKTVTRIIVEHLPSGDKQTVQTVVLTGTGAKNLVTGEVTAIKWDCGEFAAFTPATVPGYTTNISIVPEMDVTVASGDSTVEINYIPNEQTGFIIYRDENGNEITRTALQGKTGEAVAINPALPAGWELVPGQSIPATVMATPAGIPNVVVLIKHQTIIVKPGEEAPTGKVPGNPSTTYEKMESLTKEITRTITVKLPDGQRQIITQTVKFTRTATFDAVTGKVTYSGWQVDGNDEWPAYTAPEINGYTASQVSIPAEMVIPSDENQSIEIEYTKNNQPVEPDKPVTPITPDQPTTPTNPDQPAQPTEPSVPAKPIAPTNNGNKVMSGNQLPTEPVEQEKQQVSNQHFISHQLTQTSLKEKSKANILPQTGNDQNSGSILGFAFAALASILGLTGLKKKREK
ncbi:MBG domain-containing protein [Limosilactobacillus reuteri]|uniref:LPXTG-motif cell wall anchor domain protein n=1 Tax=Limosilactobacillus reuteri subsp. rodentium (strain DSM 17509 / CIP 109821 / 100-23) TaxID=349123 RepID=B3XKV5_LIMR1|nr:MBG domain-containing protein [Limosilactobacillus reuteri]EDX43010.1 LPXTG-motif cell wall anchor domain protein [Limosilactobacillus reuteri subsp. rodentium]MCC4475401.1 LPXTG cell wall anchor domain-containing protein [Limosilactobacillus reuteri]